MEIIRTIDWMKQARRSEQVSRSAHAAGRVVGFVPTMGALHEGHLSLVRAAKRQCSPVVVSIFVNPSQFGPGEDFEKYPRNFEADRALLENLGVDYIFLPQAEEMYPPGFRSSVRVEGLSDKFEGKSRPGHFFGVTTVVLKLLEIVRPQFAYFGRKDAQQARIIRQMVTDVNLDSEILVCPIVREPDGLAMSSRNAYLSSDERRAATVLSRSLAAVGEKIDSGECSAAPLLEIICGAVSSERLASLDYAAIVDADSFESVDFVKGACLVLLAVRVGSTRLIDNLLVEQHDNRFVAFL
ncbi:MAG TPA: pantoate--beta-alanine ligase [Candidatus Acidoferrales bacterium]|nr:pantoate--beta-alanine ligase [Candidatus Acidoferrales bacterium]